MPDAVKLGTSFLAVAAGHALLFKPELWASHLDRYMDSGHVSLADA